MLDDSEQGLSFQRTKLASRLISHGVQTFVTRRTVATENLSVETLSTSNREVTAPSAYSSVPPWHHRQCVPEPPPPFWENSRR